MVFVRILPNYFWCSWNLAGFSHEFSNSFKSSLVLFEFDRILLQLFGFISDFFVFSVFLSDSSEFSPILSEFRWILSSFFGSFRILSDWRRIFEILRDSIGFSRIPWIFPDSSEFSHIFVRSFGFFRIFSYSHGFFRIFPDSFRSSRNLAAFSRNFSDFFSFFWILSDPVGIWSDSSIFFLILSNSRGFFQLFWDSPKYRNMWI